MPIIRDVCINVMLKFSVKNYDLNNVLLSKEKTKTKQNKMRNIAQVYLEVCYF